MNTDLLKDFKNKAISRTVDAFPDLSPQERYKLFLMDRCNYSKDVIEAVFKADGNKSFKS